MGRRGDGAFHYAVRDVKAEVVPHELSGHLSRQGPPPEHMIFSETQAVDIQARTERADCKLDKYFQNRRLRDAPPKPEAPAPQQPEPLRSVITRKPGDEGRATFWYQFVAGSGERIVERNTALYVCKAVLDGVVGHGASQRTKLNFVDGDVLIADLLATLEQMTGTAAWKWLLKKAEVQ